MMNVRLSWSRKLIYMAILLCNVSLAGPENKKPSEAQGKASDSQHIIEYSVNRDLTLVGIIFGPNHFNRKAIIVSPKNSDKTYHEGEKIKDGLLIHEIKTDRIIVDNKGKLEIVYLGDRRTKSSNSKRLKRPGNESELSTDDTSASVVSAERPRYKPRTPRDVLGGKTYQQYIADGGSEREYYQSIKGRIPKLRYKDKGAEFLIPKRPGM